MDTNKVKEVFSDQEFVKTLFQMETPAEAQKALKEKGLDFSEKDVLRLRDEIVKNIENGTTADELSLDQLDDVAGGSVGLAIACVVVVAVTVPLVVKLIKSGNTRW